ncbi:MAG: calcium/sodium antiporter [Cyanobacteria bacterium J06636_16]
MSASVALRSHSSSLLHVIKPFDNQDDTQAMPELFVPILIFVISLTVLVKSADFFTECAERLGLLIGLPPFIIGVTIVSLGTSIPELVASILGVFQGASEVVISNVIGSNIANICLVLGVASVMSVKSLQIAYDLVSVDLPLFVGSAFLLSLMVKDESFSKGEALLLVVGYLVYLFYTLKGSEQPTASETPENGEELPGVRTDNASSQVLRQLILIVASSIAIFLGARYTIASLIQISAILNIGKEIIAVSVVALGTSLPELLVTANAALKGKAEIAVGNVLGSNIFNIFIVMGISGLVGRLTIPRSVIETGIPTLLAATLLMFFTTQDRRLSVWEGWLFFILYFWFIAHTFNWI